MTLFGRVDTYVVLSGLFSLAVLALTAKRRHQAIFDLGAMFAAAGFVSMMCIAGFLMADHAIDTLNDADLRTIGKHAEGTIVDSELLVDHGRGGRSRYCPLVRFVASDGVPRNISVHESHCSDSADRRDLPLHVAVTYLETKPDVAKVLEWQSPRGDQEKSIGFACAACAAFFLWLYSVVR